MVPLMCFVGVATVATADPVVDCSHRSLADVVDKVLVQDTVIMFTGVCNGPIVIGVDGITLQGVGNAVIDGGGRHLPLRCHRPRAWHERHHLSALETVDERATPTRKEVVNRRLRG